MNRSRRFGTLVTVLAAAALVVPVAGTASAVGTPTAKKPVDIEARRVDRVPTPVPAWFDCSAVFGPGNECATVELPLDYDKPKGETTSVAVLRHKASDQANKVGSLFLNPGGPGGSGVEIAAAAEFFLSPELLTKFDVIGIDPRGTNYSDNVRCWADVGAQSADLAGMNVAFPVTGAEENAFVASAKKFGKACSTTGTPLSGSMSTAQVARDMDVMRRAVGDEKLTYLGFSYGTYLGNVYANMFPSRVRAVAIDGVLDPIGWSGLEAGTTTPQTMRIRSGEGAAGALHEILSRCAAAGPEYCALAGVGDPETVYADILASLQAQPLPIPDPDTGEIAFELTYATLVSILLGDMYGPDAASWVDADLTFVHTLLQPPAEPGTEAAAQQDAARAALLQKVRDAQGAAQAAAKTTADRAAAFGFEFPYPNGAEAFQSVLCTDGRNPSRADQWPYYADRAQQSAPEFGPLWTWASAPCASQTWTVRDEDTWTGSFSAQTAAPVLVVGNYWDPATNYDGAVAAASLLPNSRLLSSDSWGHTAYGTSECATSAVDQYLLTVAVPEPDTLCTGDMQPFTDPLPVPGAPDAGARSATPDRLPPVVPPLPGAVPRS
jgi:pimeloyl-ACP methyl ester carboxylesterase